MELKDAVIAIRGTLKRDPKELQAAWLTISEHFASIERPKMADQFVPAWRRERADEIGLAELTDRDLKSAWQLGEAVGGPGPVRLLIESECEVHHPTSILQWLRNRNKPAAEPVKPSEEVQRQMAPVETQDGREELLRVANNARIELMSAIKQLATGYGVMLGARDSDGFDELSKYVRLWPQTGETWNEACSERLVELGNAQDGEIVGYAQGVALRIVVDRVRCEVRRYGDGTGVKVIEIMEG